MIQPFLQLLQALRTKELISEETYYELIDKTYDVLQDALQKYELSEDYQEYAHLQCRYLNFVKNYRDVSFLRKNYASEIPEDEKLLKPHIIELSKMDWEKRLNMGEKDIAYYKELAQKFAHLL